MPRVGDSAEPPSVAVDRDRLTRRERGVWRLALLLLGALAIAFAAISWDQSRRVRERRSLGYRVSALAA